MAEKRFILLRRFWDSFRILRKSKMAMVGLAILVFYLFMALAAPILTPYQPLGELVSGGLAPPSWLYSFEEGAYLSANIEVPPSGQGFTTQETLLAWTFAGTPQDSVTAIYTSGGGGVTPGGVDVSYKRSSSLSSPVTAGASLYQSFNFPYGGPPKRFLASLLVKVVGASTDDTIAVRLFLDRLGDTRFYFWTAVLKADPQGWFGSPVRMESTDPTFKTKVLGIGEFVSMPTEQIVFSRKGDYSFGLEVQFTDTGSAPTKEAHVYVDDMSLKLFGTSWGLLGTDNLGHDIWSQLVYGTRISLSVGLLAAFIGVAVGLMAGLVAGYAGKAVDEILMRFTDMLLVLPGLPLLLVLIAVLGPSFWNLVIVLGFLGWQGFARIVRSQVLSIRERPFVEAARASGAGTFYTIRRHIFPNVVSLTYVSLALSVPAAIISEAALSWLGLFDPTVMSWGRMLFLAQIQGGGSFRWWWVLPAGASIALLSLSFVLIGYALDEIFNPRLRQRK